MQTTLDKAGRVVIPASVRERASLGPGTRLEVLLDGNTVRLIPNVARPRLVQWNDRWIAMPTAPTSELPPVDAASILEEERDRGPV
ncbi:MAG: hypothetical protein COZ06_06270 [Armatimonadetes bacterium CG_4_10_14_3_um_filter_66_18]|nr:AbrB/MazE/SpoVT family DNA-binding domain-containing protein [Armatimonadota bacterium]PIU89910.1 MAG: hypothetical protein COS65_26910 [Armatimonadetes bacterium CG06_land_8_20_14_3_00_66_21]PIX41761.1 MAG: hypothetical protein COZ57_22760 [Armatimonadetes bacterium CG_4_8_14_3_um_filter_66_20]PIY51057.1 MAG: hypothetical protein COZ06_06270 [Armatimonadetes bacterium CG_4_10_14_3_um_filter_66_18]PIZ38561.1 MAG: hypothetical protein COY42_23060 [Armatimonadetes bacterium CG_4_10_14_0_8_um_f